MRKNITTILILLFVFGVALSASADTVVWTGDSGTDNLASNPGNWSGGLVPQNGDEVVFDATSSIDCTWNLTVSLASLSIKSGYTGKVTLLSGTLTILNTINWTGGGTDNLASNPANWSGGVVPQNGDEVVFDNTTSEECIWNINIIPDFVSFIGYTGTVTLNSNLTINGSLTVTSGILDLNNMNLNVDGYLLITGGGSLYATSSTITVNGNWSNSGNFSAGSSTVVLNGINQTIYGSTTFYNLIKTVTSADTLYFQAGTTQTISNSLTLQGTAGNLLSLRSTEDDSYWYLDPQGTRNVSFVDVRDLYNISFVNIVTTDSVDSGNNTDVSFGGSECVCQEERLIFAHVLCDDWRLPC